MPKAQLIFEVLLWGLPGLAALTLGLRHPVDRRAAWLVAALACAVIALDKGVDLVTPVTNLGRDWVAELSAELRSGGSNQLGRAALLAVLFLGGCLALYLLTRLDRAIDGPKRLTLIGLVGVMGYMGGRLLPVLRESFGNPVVTWGVELTCWAAVVGGELWGRRRRL